ncbi:MAG: Rhomboid family protein [Ectothiorhodospiraceae bacterium]|jgi:hypothetical protein
MRSSSQPRSLPWPELSDDSAVQLQALLSDFLVLFESHYLGQIHRYHHERSQENLTQLSFLSDDPIPPENPDSPPF